MQLTDVAWTVPEPLLPPWRVGGRPRPWHDDRHVIHGVLWILATGCPWRDLPGHSARQTCDHRFNTPAKDAKDGTWGWLYQAVLERLERRRALDWVLVRRWHLQLRLHAAAGPRK